MLKAKVSLSKASFNTSRLDTRWAPTAFHQPRLRHHVQLLDLAGSTRWSHWWRWMRCLELSRIAAQLCRRFRGLIGRRDFRHCSPHSGKMKTSDCGCECPVSQPHCDFVKELGLVPNAPDQNNCIDLSTLCLQAQWPVKFLPACNRERERVFNRNQLKKTTKLRGCRYSWNVSLAFGGPDYSISSLWDLFVSWISFEPSEKLCLAGPDCLDGSLSSALSPLDCNNSKGLCCFGLEVAAKPTVSPYVRGTFLLVFKNCKNV